MLFSEGLKWLNDKVTPSGNFVSGYNDPSNIDFYFYNQLKYNQSVLDQYQNILTWMAKMGKITQLNKNIKYFNYPQQNPKPKNIFSQQYVMDDNGDYE